MLFYGIQKIIPKKLCDFCLFESHKPNWLKNHINIVMEYIFNGLKVNYDFCQSEQTYQNKQNENEKQTKDAVLFLHGWGGSMASFFGVQQFLNSQNFTTINLDFFGFGKSDEPNKDFCLDDYAKMVESLLDFLQVKRVQIVAHSFGGRVAIKLASSTNIVSKLVLVDSAGIKPRFNIKTFVKIKKYKFLKYLKSKKLIKTDLKKFGSSDYAVLSPNMKKVFVRVINEDLTKNLKNIFCQTLLIWGEKDKETPLYMAKKMKKYIKNSEIIVYKNAGHFSYIEKYNDFLLAIYSFLSKI